MRRLEDLTFLVGTAGHGPCFEELPPDRWPITPAPRRAAVLGHHQGFEWLGFETEGAPGLLAGRLARRLEQAGRPAAVMVLDSQHRVLAIAVSFAPRPLLTIELASPSRLALHCLERLPGGGENGALGAAAHLARALDADAVGRRFFAEFRRVLHGMMDALPARMPVAERHAVALLQLTRVLFLYFVQAKGWLDGRSRFFRDEVDRALARGEPLHDGLLRPLFFGTLNQPRERRRALARRFGAIPFLNGGLFEPHALERRWRVELSDPLWQDAFDSVFERFHFASADDEPEAIAPEMLGRVFEGVMDPDERSGSGTFYTPSALVTAMVRAALGAHLAEHLGCSAGDAERRLIEPDPAARALLAQVTILDPAAGSGAFLLGALRELSRATDAERFAARARVLTANLFGVDLNPAAVRLTELRLWLALIEADHTGDPGQVRPLPNLDGVVRQGDSLMDPLLPGWQPPADHPSVGEVRALRRRLQEVRGGEKATVLRGLRRAEARLLAASLRAAEGAAQARLEDLLGLGRAATLFGDRRGLDRREHQLVRRLRARRRYLFHLRRRLARDGVHPWFHFPSQFAEVFAERGGFDVVMGNPPWVRAEALPAPVRRQLADRYRWWRVGERRAGYGHQPDLAVAFLERACELAARRGTVAFLVPAKLATAGYAAGARAALACQTTMRVLADLTHDPRASFEATTYPMALVATTTPPPPDHRVRRSLDATAQADVPQARLGAGPWVLVPEPVARALERLRAEHPRLGQRFTCHLGVKTGLNRVFLNPAVSVEPELLFWAIRGRDLGAFAMSPACRLLWTHGANGDPLTALPARARAYLEQHRSALEQRRDYQGGPYWMVFRVRAAIAPHRVVWADLAPRLEAAALVGPATERLIPLNTCYITPTADAATATCLAAWLNSTWLRAAAAVGADPASGGYCRFNAHVLQALPVPDQVLTDSDLVELGRAGQAGTLTQRNLDEACNRFLGLSPDDCRALAAVVPPAGRRRR